MEKELRELEEKLKEMNEEKKTLTADGSYMEKELETVFFFPLYIYRFIIMVVPSRGSCMTISIMKQYR